MKGSVIGLTVLLCACSVGAEEALEEFSWSKLKAEGRLKNGTVVPTDAGKAFESLAVRNEKSEVRVITVLTIDRPKITASTYALRGEVSYEGVEGTGHLEMWNHFPDASAYFSRTLASSGVLQSLTGSSDWRPFSLPFFLKDDPRRPNKVVFNVVLPGKGRVELSPVRLVQYEGVSVHTAAESGTQIADHLSRMLSGGLPPEYDDVVKKGLAKEKAGRISRMTVRGGTLNAREIDPKMPLVRVLPGAEIRGSVKILVDNPLPASSVFPVGWTPSWGDHRASARTIVRSARPGRTAYQVPIDLKAPAKPGYYFLAFACAGQMRVSNIMSATQWKFPDRWDDGKDIADLSFPQIGWAIEHGWFPLMESVKDEYQTTYYGGTAVIVEATAGGRAAWWTRRQVQAGGGVAAGVLAVVCVVLFWVAYRGKARTFVLVALKVILAIGGICLILGVLAVASSQHYSVSFPVLLLGIIFTVMPLTVIRAARRRYEHLELRKMEALDAP